MVMRSSFLVAVVIGLLFTPSLQAATVDTTGVSSDDGLVVRIVFFTPSDVEPPDGARQRMKEIVDYTQAFFAKWMKHWGYEPDVVLPVNRDKDGFPEILFVKGKHTLASGKYDKLGFANEIKETAAQQYGIPAEGQFWWFFMYKAVETGWGRGGGSVQGGTSNARYFTNPGTIGINDDLASGLLLDISLKGAIHEFGHALGLPHIGPQDGDDLGNTLMGPNNPAYASKKNPNEPRVYLSKAAAAMLYRHPLFTGTTRNRDRMPRIQISDINAAYDRANKRIEVTGKLKPAGVAHSVVIGNAAKRVGSYWQKAFVGKIDKDGSFKVHVEELPKTGGVLKIGMCFNNGAIKGKGNGLGFTRTAIEKPYTFTKNGYVFAD